MFKEYDDLFGLKEEYSRSHDVISRCSFYLAGGSITPEWDDHVEMKEIQYLQRGKDI